VTPAQYWKSKVWYADFAVDYYFLDTNVFDAFEPQDFTGHNLCSIQHNPENATCAPQGPKSIWDCPRWFQDLWASQQAWIDAEMTNSTADWQVVVTHFPPNWGKEFWVPLVRKFGVDLVITGHTHHQELHGAGEDGNFLGSTAYIISGGGGGITSQEEPNITGEDDQYGFMDIALSAETLSIEAISHGGLVRKTVVVHPRYPDPPLETSKAQARRRHGSRRSHLSAASEDHEEEQEEDESEPVKESSGDDDASRGTSNASHVTSTRRQPDSGSARSADRQSDSGSAHQRQDSHHSDEREEGTESHGHEREEGTESRRPHRDVVDKLAESDSHRHRPNSADERERDRRETRRPRGDGTKHQEAGHTDADEQETDRGSHARHDNAQEDSHPVARDADATIISDLATVPLEAAIARARRKTTQSAGTNSSDSNSGLDDALKAKPSSLHGSRGRGRGRSGASSSAREGEGDETRVVLQ